MYVFFSILLMQSVLFSQHIAYKSSQKPIIDGRIENVWKSANQFSKFTLYEPVVYGTPSVKTTAYFMYDEENIYIAAVSYQSELSSTRFKRDDQSILKNDYLQFEFDPFADGTKGYFITVNPHNSFADGEISRSGIYDFKQDINVIYQARIYDDRWEVEIRIPLENLDFQSKESQDWYISFIRHYAFKGESMASHQVNRNDIKRLASYTRVRNLKNLRRAKSIQITPYINNLYVDDALNGEKRNKFGKGFDFSYKPGPNLNILFTVNPDYAQIESDKAVINVSDEPTRFPEKRPFFTSNLYRLITGVQTRKVNDIDYGIRTYSQAGLLQYDLTYLSDKESNTWLFNKIQYSRSSSYKHKLVTGLKWTSDKTFMNNVLMNQWYFLDKKLWLTNYLEFTTRDGNQFGDISFITYKTRDWLLQYKSVLKQVGHNPEEIAYKVYSNRNEHNFRFYYIFRNDQSFLQSLKSEFLFSHFKLLSGNSSYFNTTNLSVTAKFTLGSLGIWEKYIRYKPDSGQKFRYRHDNGLNRDNYSSFDLIRDKQDEIELKLTTDQSKNFSLILSYERKAIRQANSRFLNIESRFRLTNYMTIDYSYNYGNIEKSAYQEKQEINLHRFKIDLNLNEDISIRSIYSFDKKNFPLYVDNILNQTGYHTENPVFNITGSWEYGKGSFIYFVYNDFKENDKYSSIETVERQNYKSFVFKINKLFLF